MHIMQALGVLEQQEGHSGHYRYPRSRQMPFLFLIIILQPYGLAVVLYLPVR